MEDVFGMDWNRYPKVDWLLPDAGFNMLFTQTELSTDPDASLLLQDGAAADMPKSSGLDRHI